MSRLHPITKIWRRSLKDKGLLKVVDFDALGIFHAHSELVELVTNDPDGFGYCGTVVRRLEHDFERLLAALRWETLANRELFAD